jgi:hypothetical protein
MQLEKTLQCVLIIDAMRRSRSSSANKHKFNFNWIVCERFLFFTRAAGVPG